MTDYERGPQQLWADPKQELFTEKSGLHSIKGGFMPWDKFRWLVTGVGAAIGFVIGVIGESFFHIAAGALIGGMLGYFLPVPFKEAYEKSLFQWFYLALLYIIPTVVVLLLPLAVGALKIVLVIGVILLVLSLFGG